MPLFTDALTLNAKTPATPTEGMAWNDGDTLSYKPDASGIVQQMGETERKFFNDTGSTIPNGAAVYMPGGTHGDQIKIELATAALAASSRAFIGIATHDIPDNESGWVQRFGDVRGLGVSVIPAAYPVGADLYLNHVAGGLSTNRSDTYVGKVARKYGNFSDVFVMPHFDASTIPIANVTGIPGPGCTMLGASTLITGATTVYEASPTAAYTLNVTNTAPRYVYTLRVEATNAYSLAAGLTEDVPLTTTGTNEFIFKPSGTGTAWRVYGRAL
jgi:hypothetical protein